MAESKPKILNQLRPSRLLWPLLIGVAVFAYAIYQIRQEGINPIHEINWSGSVLGWIILGFLVMIIRDVGYIWRMRILTDQKLSWRSAIEVTLLWEFASSLTPSVVGGSAVAIFMLMKEKITAGRSTAIVFVTIFLDEVFYLVMLPLVLIVVGQADIFGPVNDDTGAFGMGLIISFWAAYGIIFCYTLFLAFALFIRPNGTSRVFKRLFSTRLLKRWQRSGFNMANDLLVSANEFRKKKFSYWLEAGAATFIAWMGRYLVLNCVLAAFSLLSIYQHLVAFGRQAIMFVVMIVSPTPGSSGVAESLFANLFSEFSPAGLELILATVWRIISYYPYLLIGIFLLPRWISRVFKNPAPKPKNPPENKKMEQKLEPAEAEN
ncbi:MAG: flippase-like domain-containing protein [Bacteroidetes bacterium]|nr:flippase-like domain-containing protein [Bacteroidota bacterium]